MGINSLAPGRSECDSKNWIFNFVSLIVIFRASHDNALRWMPQDLTDDKSTLVQVMTWCRQATSHYLSQCWLSPLSSYDVAGSQWANTELHIHWPRTMTLDWLPLKDFLGVIGKTAGIRWWIVCEFWNSSWLRKNTCLYDAFLIWKFEFKYMLKDKFSVITL